MQQIKFIKGGVEVLGREEDTSESQTQITWNKAAQKSTYREKRFVTSLNKVGDPTAMVW